MFLGFDIPFDRVKAALQEHLSIDANATARTIKLVFKGTVYEDMPFMDMLDDEEGLKRMARNFMDEEIAYTVEPLPDGQGVVLHFETDDAYQKMYEFIDRLVSVALPRVRDFRGINEKGFDGRGNYTLGVKEQIIFPEISIDKINRISGMDITFEVGIC